MRNLNRMTNYWNNVEAWRDWKRYEDCAIKNGQAELAANLRPPEGAPWRKVDKQIDKLAEALEALGIPCTPGAKSFLTVEG